MKRSLEIDDSTWYILHQHAAGMIGEANDAQAAFAMKAALVS